MMDKTSRTIKGLGAVVLICLTGVVSAAWADVTLRLPNNISMIALNGKNAKAVQTVPLPEGINQIALRFEGNLRDYGVQNPQGTDLGISDVFVIKVTAMNQDLTMEIPHITSTAQLEAFNKNPDIKIKDTTGQVIPVAIDRLEKQGLVIFRNYEKELVEFNASNSPAAVKPAMTAAAQGMPQPGAVPSPPAMGVAAAPAPPPTPAPTADANRSEMMLNYWYDQADAATQQRFRVEMMLRYWYEQADAATRERFKAWINQ